MSKVTKQKSLTKTVHRDPSSDKTKPKIKASTKSSNANPKEAITTAQAATAAAAATTTAAVKRKIVKENGVHSIDESKKREKKPSTVVKSSSNTKSDKIDKKHDTKVKVASKTVPNGKSVKNGSSIEKVDKKVVKKVPSVDKRDAKKIKDKLNSSSEKHASEVEVAKLVKTSDSPMKSKTVSKRTAAPLKASHTIAKSNAPVSATVASTAVNISTKNVMNQVHNVTVQSPPPVRRELEIPVKIDVDEQHKEKVQSGLPRSRTRTRTLDRDEVVLLKSKPTAIEPHSLTNPPVDGDEKSGCDSVMVEIKPPISFEVMLNDENKTKPLQNKSEKIAEKLLIENGIKTHSNKESTIGVVVNKSDQESDGYEDDFESYESDFESDLSNEDDDESQTSISSGESESDENVVSTASKHPFETGHSIDNSEFDSGSFEMKVLSARSRVHNDTEPIAERVDHQFEMQNDSGIETVGGNALIMTPTTHNGQMNSLDFNNKTFDNISDIEIEGVNSLDTNNSNTNKSSNSVSVKAKIKSRLKKRGEELLSKITLDTMNYVLFDFKPIPYELFMKIYGCSNTTQAAVQTHNDHHDQECQSDTIATQTRWSQYPITYYSENSKRMDFDDYKNGCGLIVDDQKLNQSNENVNHTCENSLNVIRSMSFNMNSSLDTNSKENDNERLIKTNIDYSKLNRFLLENEVTLSRILNTHVHNKLYSLKESVLPISDGYFTLKPAFQSNVTNERIHRIFAVDSLPGFLFTLHSDQTKINLHVMALWSLSKMNEPICLLSVWSKILCVEIHPKVRDIVFAGLDDGSIAVWDYSESKYWHPNLNEEVKRFVPTQITTPTFETKDDAQDFGRCVAIRALPIATDTDLLNGYNPKQMCSLHECGLLILWTMLCNTTGVYNDLVNKRIDHQSLWSKIKLIQNKVIDLRASVRQMTQLKLSRPTSKSFDKTRSYFESELFSDAALQELHQMNSDEEKLLTTFRCNAIELTSEGILISTNENFLLFGRKSFKNESFRRIQIDANKSIRVECMVSLFGYDDDIVVIALNNGAVKTICCGQRNDSIDDIQPNSDNEDSLSSNSSITPIAGDNGKAPQLNLPIESINITMGSASDGPVQTAMAAPLHATTGFFADGNNLNFGKSCTIQSLVLNERKIYDEMQKNLENNEYKTAMETLSTNTAKNGSNTHKSIKCIQLMNGQTIFRNSIDIFSTLSRQCLVQLVKSNKLITLHKYRIRIYDLLMNQIIDMPSNQINQKKFIDATTTTADHNEEYFILLNADGIVELHQITMEPNNC